MRREDITIGHKKISYLIYEPSAPAVRQHPLRTVVFVHAFPLQAAMWEPNLGAVPDGWRAIAPDLRGFGQSLLPPSSADARSGAAGPRMTDLAGDVIDLLDHLEITEAAVVGCSMGGYVLFEMLKSARRYISAAALVSTRAGADSDQGKVNREKMIEQVDREGVDAIAAQMVPKLLGATTQRERPDLIKHVRNLVLANTGPGIKAGIRAMMERGDSTPLLPGMKIPTLVVAGAEDTLIPPAEGEAMHRAIPEARYELMPFAGHLPNLEQPVQFEAVLRQFLRNL